MKDIFLATGNKAKIERYTMLLRIVDDSIRIHTPESLGIPEIDVEENADTLAGNAELKVRAYAGKVDMPILANDTGFWVDGMGLVDAPKRQALGGSEGNDLSYEEKAQKLVLFWQGIAEKNGGEVDAAWIDEFVLLLPDGTLKSATGRRDVILTNIVHGSSHDQFPIRRLYISKATGKPACTHNEDDEKKEMKPLIDALASLMKK